MPQIKDIFEKENGRLTSGDMNAVYLYPEGTFYRAYEWSAWLCCRYISQFKATRREIKSESGQTMVFVGFPTTSLTKFVPDEAETVINDDKSVSIFLPKRLFAETDNVDLLQKEFEYWKESVPVRLDLQSTSSAGFAIQPCRNIRICNPIRQRTIRLFRIENADIQYKILNL